MKLTALFLACTLSLFAVNPFFTPSNRNSKWPPQGGQYSFGGPYEIYWQAVPTSLTDMEAGTNDIHIIGYTFYNTAGTSITLTIQTKDASPIALPLSGPIAAGQSVSFNIPTGLLSKHGMSVQASGAGVNFSVQWTH